MAALSGPQPASSETCYDRLAHPHRAVVVGLVYLSCQAVQGTERRLLSSKT